MEQILKNTRGTLEVNFSLGDADANNVTVTITRADGTTLVSGASASHGATGQYTYALSPQTELDYLTVVWTGAWGGVTQSITTYAEILGQNLFSIADLRSFGDKVLVDTSLYPDTDLRSARARITDLFQDVCQISFVPRFYRETLDGTGTSRMWLRWKRVRRIISATVDGAAADLTKLKVFPTGRLERTDTTWPVPVGLQNVAVSYEHGWDAPPLDISRAAMTLARYELVSNDISDRMISFENDLGSVRLSIPGRNYPTGIPTVDATLARYDETDPLPPY